MFKKILLTSLLIYLVKTQDTCKANDPKTKPCDQAAIADNFCCSLTVKDLSKEDDEGTQSCISVPFSTLPTTKNEEEGEKILKQYVKNMTTEGFPADWELSISCQTGEGENPTHYSANYELDDKCGEDVESPSIENCKKVVGLANEKKCCYYKVKDSAGTEDSGCTALEKEQYNDIDATMKAFKEQDSSIDSGTIDCGDGKSAKSSSNFLKMTNTMIIALFVLLF